MRCEEIAEHLVSFVLGELNEEETEAVRAHLDSCGECSAEVAQYRQTLLALGRWKVPAHGRPPDFAFLPAPPVARESPLSPKRRIREYAPALLAVFLVVLFAAAFYFGTHVRYDGGGITVTIGRVATASPAADSARIAAIVDSVRQQDFRFLSELVAASEARQASYYQAGLESLSRQMESRQIQYTNYLMNHIYRLQRQDQIAYYQSRAALDGMVKIANAVK